MGKIAEEVTKLGMPNVKLTFGGWTAKPANVEKTISDLNALKIDKNDILVIDSMANAAFMGTNDDGLPIPATKAAGDGRYHLEGELQAAPNSVFLKCCERSREND